MRNMPLWFVHICRKETGSNSCSQLVEGAMYDLRESSLIADFVKDVDGVDEDSPFTARESQFIDFTVLFGDFHKGVNGRILVNVAKVSYDGQARRRGNFGGHGVFRG